VSQGQQKEGSSGGLPTAALLVETDNDGFHLFHGVKEADDYYREKKIVADEYDRPAGWVPDELNRDELVRRADVIDYLEIKNLIDHLSTAHRNLQRMDHEGDMEDAIGENQRLQYKLQQLLEEVQASK